MARRFSFPRNLGGGRRNHFSMAAKPSGNHHPIRLPPIRIAWVWIYVEFFSQCGQTHLSEGYAGRLVILHGVCGDQLFFERTVRKYLRFEKGGSGGSYRRRSGAGSLIAQEKGRPTRSEAALKGKARGQSPAPLFCAANISTFPQQRISDEA
jgi:hypothetical protein